MDANSLTRQNTFTEESTAKRRKFNPACDSQNDSGDELFADYIEEPTLPLDATIPTQPLDDSWTPIKNTLNPDDFTYSALTSQAVSSPTQFSYSTQPTQILPPQNQRYEPEVLVKATSPIRAPESSPPRPSSPRPAQSAQLPDAAIKPFDFYGSGSHADPSVIDSDGPTYIGSSDGETSDHGIKPVFRKKPIPSASAIRGRRETQEVNRVSQSPIAANTAINSSKPAGRLDTLQRKLNFSPSPGAAPPGRLDSLQRKPIGYGSVPMPALHSAQRRPEPALPINDITLEQISNKEYQATVSRMKTVLPTQSIKTLLSTLMRMNGNYDEAMEELCGAVDVKNEPVGVPTIKTANRGAGAGKVAIKDKWSSTQAVRNDPVSFSPPPIVPVRKRKLVRGSNRNSKERSESPVTISIDDSDSDAEEGEDYADERELEAKVLKYLNSCNVKELSDIACTTDDIAEIIISKRPFSSINTIRAVTAAGKNGKGRTRPIGDKVVDVCIETMRGYDAVDSLISKVEALGKPLAESMKAWGVDVNTGGEIEMTDLHIESDSGSAKDSGIGTPSEELEEVKAAKRTKITTFIEQPKIMRPGVVLKDYQLAGVNWLNLLYEKNLSCILADEMGMSLIPHLDTNY